LQLLGAGHQLRAGLAGRHELLQLAKDRADVLLEFTERLLQFAELRARFGVSGGSGLPPDWLFIIEPEIRSERTFSRLVPDVAGWRRARMPAVPDVAFFTLPPDWLCEILSTSTSSFDRATKLAIYAREGVPWAWLVDPLARTLEVLKLENGRWTILATHAGTEVVRAEPFEAVELELAALWGDIGDARSSPD
jgi:hypothetical protein